MAFPSVLFALKSCHPPGRPYSAPFSAGTWGLFLTCRQGLQVPSTCVPTTHDSCPSAISYQNSVCLPQSTTIRSARISNSHGLPCTELLTFCSCDTGRRRDPQPAGLVADSLCSDPQPGPASLGLPTQAHDQELVPASRLSRSPYLVRLLGAPPSSNLPASADFLASRVSRTFFFFFFLFLLLFSYCHARLVSARSQ